MLLNCKDTNRNLISYGKCTVKRKPNALTTNNAFKLQASCVGDREENKLQSGLGNAMSVGVNERSVLIFGADRFGHQNLTDISEVYYCQCQSAASPCSSPLKMHLQCDTSYKATGLTRLQDFQSRHRVSLDLLQGALDRPRA